MDAAIILGRARAAESGANEWKAIAKKLVCDNRIHKANTAGMEALKDAAMKELARLDPNNYLMTQRNRQQIFDAAYTPVKEGKRTT